jgi:transcriptional regulator with XRE-family HTH domain
MDIKIGERVKSVRKSLNFTQDEFCKRIGISRDALNNIEHARLKTLPENTVRLICATFNIDYFWLTTGEGEMFHQSDNPVADRIDDLLEGENETAKALFRAFAYFSDDDWKLVQKFMDRLIEARNTQKKDGPEQAV